MATYILTPEQLAQYFGSRPGVLELEMRGALGEALHLVHSEAVRLSSGPFSLRQLRRMGHPYARRHGSIQGVNPFVVNAQTGAFRAAWQMRGPFAFAGGFGAEVRNDDPKADWIGGGTRLMLGRDVTGELERRTEAAIERVFVRRLEDAFRL